MKFRNSFVSNSSSASFILEMFTNDSSLTKEDVVNIMEEKIGTIGIDYDGLAKNDKEIINQNLKKIDSQKFVLDYWTIMYNGPENIPEFMKDFYIFHKLHPDESGFWRVDLRVEEGEK